MDTILLDKLIYIFVLLIFFKCITIGSAFNFWVWFKHGREYWDWYNKTIIDVRFESENK